MNELTIIVHTITSIAANCQLLVNYNKRVETIGDENNFIIQKIDEKGKKSKNGCVGIKNNNLNCYLNASLQLFKKIYPYHFVAENNGC